MTYREALLFVGKCLTLGHCQDRIAEVRETIRSGSVAWEQIVWVSTGQYVFPALYLQLKRAGLLPELPADLVEYMEEFTGVNRERNRQIIDQAKEITALLNRHEITPVFLKGTAHLLDGLYKDIAERMVGDIDFLVGEKDMVKAAELLIKSGYQPLAKYNPLNLKRTKHYPRLVIDKHTAGVEVHRIIIRAPYDKELDFELIAKKSRKLNLANLAFVPHDEHQILHNILNFQVDDKGYYYGRIFLRQTYDLFLLSRRENPLAVVENFGKFFHRMNAYLALSNRILGDPACLPYKHTWQANLFLNRMMMKVNYPGWARFSGVILYLLLRFSNNASRLILSTCNKGVRQSLYARLSNPKWYGAHIRSYRKIGKGGVSGIASALLLLLAEMLPCPMNLPSL